MAIKIMPEHGRARARALRAGGRPTQLDGPQVPVTECGQCTGSDYRCRGRFVRIEQDQVRTGRRTGRLWGQGTRVIRFVGHSLALPRVGSSRAGSQVDPEIRPPGTLGRGGSSTKVLHMGTTSPREGNGGAHLGRQEG
ncbi:unnamed protein product [Calypogeia fissa]